MKAQYEVSSVSSITREELLKREDTTETIQTALLRKEHLEVRERIQALCSEALRKLPPVEAIQAHWNNAVRELLMNVRLLVEKGARAQDEEWDVRETRFFVTTLNALSDAFDVGWDAGYRDGTGIAFQKKKSGDDPYDCGDAPRYPEGASCSLRCGVERAWCLCRVGCGNTVDCSSWPCTACVDCNIDHMVCAADCLISIVPPPDPDLLNPVKVPTLVARK